MEYRSCVGRGGRRGRRKHRAIVRVSRGVTRPASTAAFPDSLRLETRAPRVDPLRFQNVIPNEAAESKVDVGNLVTCLTLT